MVTEITQQTAQNAPAETSEATLAVEGMTCASCVARIERGLKKLPGVVDASVNLATEKATVQYAPAKVGVNDILHKIDDLGYQPSALDAPAPPPPAEESEITLDVSGM